ncbi:unnamed protein product [Rhizophagus irregularis]|nr:unnamed protein product [Rhizophagus irregularis]
MMNLHAATSLAEELGLDLVDIYGIRKWEAIKASPLNDPDIVAEIVRNLPVEEFGKHLLLNRTWYAWCKAELWKRHKEAESGYDQAAEKWEKANDALGQSLEEDGILRELEWEAYQKACKERTNARVKHIMDEDVFGDSDDDSDDSDGEE